MVGQDNEPVLNNVLIAMARSFLQYVSESWPWVPGGAAAATVEEQVRMIAAQQRQGVGDLVELLTEREHFIDFGSYPTEYTDLQFLSLEALMESLINSQQYVCRLLADAVVSLRTAGDDDAADLVQTIELRQQDAAGALLELRQQLRKAVPV